MRHKFFGRMGCRLSDHGMEEFYAEDYTERRSAQIFAKVMSGVKPTEEENLKFKSGMLSIRRDGRETGWTQQFHSAPSATTIAVCSATGSRHGFRPIGDVRWAAAADKFFDMLDREANSPRRSL